MLRVSKMSWENLTRKEPWWRGTHQEGLWEVVSEHVELVELELVKRL